MGFELTMSAGERPQTYALDRAATGTGPHYVCMCVCVCIYIYIYIYKHTHIQYGAEPTDTFKMVIDNIWKQGKISETVYKYVQVCYLLPTDYKLIFWTPGRWPPFTSMHCCKRVWKLPYTRLRKSSSTAATSSTVACLSSWIVTIRLRNTRSFRNPHRKKSGTVSSGDREAKRCRRNDEHR